MKRRARLNILRSVMPPVTMPVTILAIMTLVIMILPIMIRPIMAAGLAGAMLLSGCSPAPDNATDSESTSAQAIYGQITITVTATPATAEVGSPIGVQIEVTGPNTAPDMASDTAPNTAPDTAAIEVPVLGETLGVFMITSWERSPEVPTAAGRRWRHRYEMTAFETGEQQIDFPPVVQGYDASRQEFAVPPLVVTFEAVEEETRGLQGGVEIDLPLDIERLLKYGGLAFSLLLATIGVLWWWWRRTHQPPVPPPPVPAHVVALAALDDLRASGLVEAGRWDRFYEELSSIVRHYVEGRFALRAPERTTDEFLRDARRNRALSEAQRSGLGIFLRAADLVKFARHRPTAEESTDALDHAGHFVRETMQQPDSVSVSVSTPSPSPASDERTP